MGLDMGGCRRIFIDGNKIRKCGGEWERGGGWGVEKQ
jgi:hypothetical protein